MRRILSVFLPRWAIERRLIKRGQESSLSVREGAEKIGLPLPETAPFVLSIAAQNGQRITATNAAAEALGLYAGMALTDARAIYPALHVEPADLEGDAAALKKLAFWHQRYCPFTRDEAPNGVLLDITGCAHLFGGEAALLKDVQAHLEAMGLQPSLAIAPTIGAASASARFSVHAHAIVTHETLTKYLAPLPVEALRIEEATVNSLAKLGLKHIGDLIGKPRAPLAARFGSDLVRRLDQAFGKEDETFCALTPAPIHRAERRFPEPLVTQSAIERAVGLLAHDICNNLEKAGKGTRRITLTLYRVDGWFETLDVRMSAVTRQAKHLARLLCERLDRIKDDAGFGFELMTLDVFNAEKVSPHQETITSGEQQSPQESDIAPLLDRFINRFGARNVTRFLSQESYIPERAARPASVFRQTKLDGWEKALRVIDNGAPFPRPIFLFTTPEPITAISVAPDSPPVRFEWRRISHRVARADGPERIAPEWWRLKQGESRQTRDYYRVEDEAGRRFWLYRDGLYEREGDAPRWFIHGVFP